MTAPLVVDDLPPIDTARWSPQRKALVVKAVRGGAISGDEACRRYRLSAEELVSWQRAVETHGIAGLSVIRLQLLRGPRPDKGRAGRALPDYRRNPAAIGREARPFR